MQRVCIKFQPANALPNPYRRSLAMSHFPPKIAVPVPPLALRHIHIRMDVEVVEVIIQSKGHELLHDDPGVDFCCDQIASDIQEAAHGIEESSSALPRGHHIMYRELYADDVKLVRFGDAPALPGDKHRIAVPFIARLAANSTFAISASALPDFVVLGHLWSQNDVITSWLRLAAISNCFPHPH